MKLKVKIPKTPKEKRRVRQVPQLDQATREQMEAARQAGAAGGGVALSREEQALVETLRRAPETARLSSANPLVRRLVELGGGTLDTSLHARLYPEEALREYQREQTHLHGGRSSASTLMKLDDWRNAQSTRELMQKSASGAPPSRKAELPKKLPALGRQVVRSPEDAATRFAELAQSLCLRMFGENSTKQETFRRRLELSLGSLFDATDVPATDVPTLPTMLNMGARVFGGTFPTFARMGKSLSVLFADLYRNVCAEERGQADAVVGLDELTEGAMTPEDAAAWLCFFNFGLAFYEFCRLAGAEAGAGGQVYSDGSDNGDGRQKGQGA